MNIQTVVYPYNEILLSNKKKQLNIWYNLDGSQGPCSEWKSQSQYVTYFKILLYSILKMTKLQYGDHINDYWGRRDYKGEVWQSASGEVGQFHILGLMLVIEI